MSYLCTSDNLLALLQQRPRPAVVDRRASPSPIPTSLPLAFVDCLRGERIQLAALAAQPIRTITARIGTEGHIQSFLIGCYRTTLREQSTIGCLCLQPLVH